MKNKVELKKMIIISIFIILVFNIIIGICAYYQYRVYTNNFNNKIGAIIEEIFKKYPDINENEIVGILNSNEIEEKNILRDYGIDLNKDSIILKNDKYMRTFLILNSAMITVGFLIIVINFFIYNHKKDKELDEITKYIEEINKRNYKLNIYDNTEDELSILKNEIYKITVMLKEQAENSKEDKIKLKDSLSDISHQLKTPLTSILIMLDNIIDNPNMEEDIRNEFINDIKRKILNINFLIQELLKLSKFDANTIKFTDKEVKVKDVLVNSIKNVSVLSDLKDIKINVNGNEEEILYCDDKWQCEAITNILKNSVEYSKGCGVIEINFERNKLYSEIIIQDYGKGMCKEDVSHIFERFYKGKNSSKDSIGIGMALAKAIIEKDNGQVIVESEVGKGTKFIIRYFER